MQFTPYINQAPVKHNESALYEIEVTKKSFEEMLKIGNLIKTRIQK